MAQAVFALDKLSGGGIYLEIEPKLLDAYHQMVKEVQVNFCLAESGSKCAANDRVQWRTSMRNVCAKQCYWTHIGAKELMHCRKHLETHLRLCFVLKAFKIYCI